MLQKLVQNKKSKLTPIDWQIYNYVTSSKNSNFTISDVADYVHVSTTTVFRFCQKLDLSGFSELKVLLKDTDNKITKCDLVQGTYHDIVDYIENYQMTQLKEKLFRSQEIYIFAYSELELRLAKEFQRIFFPLNKPIFILPNRKALETTFDEIKNKVLFILSVDSRIDYPIILHNSGQMKSVYTVVLSDVRYIPIVSNEHMLIPIPETRYSGYSHMIITPYILALEMLYLKLQLD